MVISVQVFSQRIPGGDEITLDGIISENEWKMSRSEVLIGGGECFFFQNEKYLFVGIRGLREGWCHVYLYNKDNVHVLHASAALGAVVYRKDQMGNFQPTGSFVWDIRETSMDDSAKEKRAGYLEANDWVASTNQMGNKIEVEFIIDKNTFLRGNSRIAVVYVSDAKTTQFWPASLNDDCIKEELVFGNTPASLSFNFDQWGKLKL
jgi:hypothetical protein